MSPARRNTRNLAARMGRWSAAHWKTATFGWLAFVARRLRARRAGRDEERRPEHRRARPVRPHATGSSTPASSSRPSESVLIQSRSLRVGDPAFTRRGRGRRRARLAGSRTSSNVRSPSRRTRSVARTGARRSSSSTSAGDKDKAVDKHRPGARPASPMPSAPTRRCTSASSATRARRKAVDDRVRRRPRQGGRALDPDHADHPGVAFGALVAAGIPLLLALTAVFATFGLVALPSHAAADGAEASARWCC